MTTSPSREDFVAMLVERLSRDREQLRQEFRPQSATVRTRACRIPDLFPADVAQAIFAAFPKVDTMRRMQSVRESKYTFKQLRECDPIIEAVTFSFQDPRVMAAVEDICGMRDLIPDARLYAGGISSMVKGDFLNPHIDNSHDSERRFYRRINLLYYMTPGWSVADGGNLHLWDPRVRDPVVLPSSFNCLVLMETNKQSWHSVDRVTGAGPRCCVSNYYFSQKSFDGTEYFHITDFSAPPDQPLRRLVSRIDGRIRTAVRVLKRAGFSRKDYFK